MCLGLFRQIGSSDWTELGKEQQQASNAASLCDTPTTLEVVYVADNYPSEVTWRVIDARSNRTIAAADSRQLAYTICSSGDYIFQLADAFGYGLPCPPIVDETCITLCAFPL